MRVVLLHNAVPPDAPPDERDVLDQVESVGAALRSHGHATVPIAVDLDLASAKDRILAARPDCVFNLVEGLAGDDRGVFFLPALLDGMGLAYTGAPLQAMLMTANKPVAKRLLRDAGLPTPAWFAPGDPDSAAEALAGGRVILKPVWDHGSRGLDEADVVEVDSADALRRRLVCEVGTSPRFAERYVAGREFNLALLEGPEAPEGVEVLSPAEMCFEGYAEGRPRVVGFRAKWIPGSFEYTHTVRRFDFPEADGPLLAELSRLARECWRCCGLRGYARVDFRVDDAGRPWILEANANPCLTPDAGFAAALERAAIPYPTAIERIVRQATSTPAAASDRS